RRGRAGRPDRRGRARRDRPQAPGGGAARVAHAPRRRRRRGAAAARAQPPRRRPAAARVALGRAPARAGAARRGPGGGGRDARPGGRGAPPRARGAARARARHPPGGAVRPGARRRAAVARRPVAAAGRARGAGPAPARADRGRRVLRRLRGARERRQARRRHRRQRPRRRPRRPRRRRGRRRRRRRGRPRRRLRAARPRRPRRRPRRPPGRREPARRRDARRRGDPALVTRVVIAEDSVLLREGIARLLADAGFEVVGQAGTAEELLLKVRSYSPDVAVVDIRMPPTHTDEGLRAAREIRERHPGTAVLVLSQYVEPEYALDLLADSAEGVGYLLKDRVGDVGEFAAAVRRVAEGGSALDPAVVARLVGRTRRDDPLDRLTPREREVLGLMAEGRSNQAI